MQNLEMAGYNDIVQVNVIVASVTRCCDLTTESSSLQPAGKFPLLCWNSFAWEGG